MTTDNRDKLFAFWERVGIPTGILAVLLWGLYKIGLALAATALELGSPLVAVGVDMMKAQTSALQEISINTKNTRQLVEQDAAEGKAALILEVNKLVSFGFSRIERRVEDLEDQIKSHDAKTAPTGD